MQRVGLQASYYGHAARDCWHVRPGAGICTARRIRENTGKIADEVAALVLQFKGTLCGDMEPACAHRISSRTVGEEVYRLMRHINSPFDPYNLFNPGNHFGWPVSNRPPPASWAGYSLKLPLSRHSRSRRRMARSPPIWSNATAAAGCIKQQPPRQCAHVHRNRPMKIMSTRGRANPPFARYWNYAHHGDPCVRKSSKRRLSNCLFVVRALHPECPSKSTMALFES